MKRLVSIIVLSVLAVVSVWGASDNVVRILAIGNSFSQDAAEQYLYELFEAAGQEVIIGNMYIGGCSIDRHWVNACADSADYHYRRVEKGVKKNTPGKRLSEVIASEPWDYISFQQSSGVSGKYETYSHLGELIDYVSSLATNPDVKFMFHQTWAYQGNSDHGAFPRYGRNQLKMYNSIVASVRKAMADHPQLSFVVPSGTAIQNARTSSIGDVFCRDGYHLDLNFGRFTAACAWFGTLATDLGMENADVTQNPWKPAKVSGEYAAIVKAAAAAAIENPWQVTDMSGSLDGAAYKDTSAALETRVEDLLSRMTLQEKILQLTQYVLGRNDNVNNLGDMVKDFPAETGSFIYFGDDAALRNVMQKKAMEQSRLAIPILFGFDVIHGFRTITPIPLAQAATWNPDLVRQGCSVSAAEAYSTGVNWTFSPMVDVARDGRWGRISEGYGEDVYTNSVFCEAAVTGYQGDDLSAENNIAACLKHYVGYGASEAGRDYVPTEISAQTLWDTYLPPFKAGVDAGAATVMSAFNCINGVPASANHYTLTEVLKQMWGFEGFVVSDWNAVLQLRDQGLSEDAKEATFHAFTAGVEMDMADNYYPRYLQSLVEEGRVSAMAVDDAVRRVLALKFKLGLFERPYTEERPETERFMLPEYLESAQRLAAESMVLLKNEGSVLPLSGVGRIALIGPLADNGYHLLGNWCARGKAEDVVTIKDGIQAEFPSEIITATGCDFDGDDRSGFKEALKAAKKADVVVLCLGEKRNWSGENCSRSTIALPRIQEDLLSEVRKAGKPVVVLVSSGRPIDLVRIEPMCDALMMIWQPGVRAGSAVAGLLSGKYNPSGKLPVTMPYTSGQIPIYYNRRQTGRDHQGMYQDIPSTPKYEFAYGLSYSDFSYGPVTVSRTEFGAGEKVRAEVVVTNNSAVDGMETVHWFIADPYCSITRPYKELKFFEKQMIPAGENRTFVFEIDPARDLGYVGPDGKAFLEDGEYQVIVKDQTVKINLVE